jgi:predicted RNA binding protein YcfA (HicA-like mRNA interferase family)
MAEMSCVVIHNSLAASIILCILTQIKSRDIISKLKQDGWRHVGTAGSHHQFKHPTKPGRVTVPHPVKDVKIGTRMSIERQSGVKLG